MIGSSDRFSYEWVKFDKIIPDYERQFLKWVTPLKKEDFKNKYVLDAGCGTGRNSYWPLIYGASQVVAFDVDPDTIKVAKKNLSRFKNAQTLTNSLYDIKYSQKFDITICIGVLHHLENPKLAIENLIKATKKGGKIVCWVYGKEGNEWITRYVNPIRLITSRLPLKLTNILALILSIILFIYLKISDHKGEYFKQLKAFSLWHIHSIVFDHLIPKIANYWSKNDVNRLFSSKLITNIKINSVNGMSWAIVGTKN